MKTTTVDGVDYSKPIGKKDMELNSSIILDGLKTMNQAAME